jgi:hypothetical protein
MVLKDRFILADGSSELLPITRNFCCACMSIMRNVLVK